MAERKKVVQDTFTTRTKRYRLFVVFLLVLSASFLLMPFSMSIDGAINPLIYFSGACFWIGLIGTIGFAISINTLRKSDKEFQENYANTKRIGIIQFFTNKSAMIADIVMIISLIVLIIVRVLKGNIILSFILIALFVFSFGMHCMLNGINYIYINDSRRKRRERTL